MQNCWIRFFNWLGITVYFIHCTLETVSHYSFSNKVVGTEPPSLPVGVLCWVWNRPSSKRYTWLRPWLTFFLLSFCVNCHLTWLQINPQCIYWLFSFYDKGDWPFQRSILFLKKKLKSGGPVIVICCVQWFLSKCLFYYELHLWIASLGAEWLRQGSL